MEWKIENRIAVSSGESDVFLVSKNAIKAVLKIYRFGLAPKSEVLEKIKKLAKGNPGLFVEPLEFGIDPDSNRFYEIDEFIPEGMFSEILAQGRLSENHIFDFLKKISKALSLMHEQGILHLDLKPANILVRKKEPLDFAVSDFGISSIFDAELSKKLTAVKGTSLYQSPESIAGVVVLKSDWWSLGMIILEMLLGKHPFEDLQRQVILYNLTTFGVEIPDELPTKWKNLLMGLLTREPEKRWGIDEVRQWLSGKSPEVLYKFEKSNSQTSSNPKFQIPFNFGGSSRYSLLEILEESFSTPQLWEEAKAALFRGNIADWLEKNGDSENAQQIRKTIESETDPDLVLFRTALFYKPSLPFHWRGKIVDPVFLKKTLSEKSAGKETDSDSLFNGLFSGVYFQDYIRFAEHGLGDIEPFFRLAQNIKNSKLAKLPTSKKAEIILAAQRGSFETENARNLLIDAFRGNESPLTEILNLTMEPGFAEFAKQSSIFRQNEFEIWAMVSRIVSKKSSLLKFDLKPFFAHSEEIFISAQKNQGIRDFVAKVFGKPTMDITFANQIKTLTSEAKWVSSLVLGIYGFSPQENLDHCLGILTMALSLKQKWTHFSSTYLLPPVMEKVQAGKIVTPEELGLVRKLIEEPDLLIRKKLSSFQTWNEFADFHLIKETEITSPADFRKIKKLVFYSGVKKFFWRLGWGFFFICLLAVFIPNYPRHHHERAPERACYANMRVILGAIEMYNMDIPSSTAMITTDIPDLTESPGILGGYLRGSIRKPEDSCSYSIGGDITKAEGRIKCITHGTVEAD